MIKYRVHEVAKDMGLQSKELMDFLSPIMELPKKHMTTLDEQTMNLIYDHFTKKYENKGFRLPTEQGLAAGRRRRKAG